jgi:hypothetical protein
MGGLNTPPVLLKLLKPLGDDKLGDIIVEDSIGGLIDRGVV